MKEENLFHRRLSLCPSATSPPKIDPRTLTRNLSYGGGNEIYSLSPGRRLRLQSWQMWNYLYSRNISQRNPVSYWKFDILYCKIFDPFRSTLFAAYLLLWWLPRFNCLSAGFNHWAHLCVTVCCGFPPGSETDRNALSMLSNEFSPAQSPDSKVRTHFLVGQLLNRSQ